MPMLAIIHQMRKGFTLIELMVVVVILALSATMIVVRLNVNGNPEVVIERQAEQLLSMLSLAQNRAVFQSAIVGMRIDKSEISFWRWRKNKVGNQGKWLSMDDRNLKNLKAPEFITYQLESDETVPGPQVVFLESGDSTAFTLHIIGRKAKGVIIGNGVGQIDFKR